MPQSPALGITPSPAAAHASAKGSRAKLEEQWKQVVRLGVHGVRDGTEQGVNI